METCYPTQAIGKKIGLVLKVGLWISTDIAGTKNRVLGISDLIQIRKTSTNFKPIFNSNYIVFRERFLMERRDWDWWWNIRDFYFGRMDSGYQSQYK